MNQTVETLTPGEFIAFRINALRSVSGTVPLGIVCGLDIDLTGLTGFVPVIRNPKFKDGLVEIKIRRTYANPPEIKDHHGTPLKRDGRFFVFEHYVEFTV